MKGRVGSKEKRKVKGELREYRKGEGRVEIVNSTSRERESGERVPLGSHQSTIRGAKCHDEAL